MAVSLLSPALANPCKEGVGGFSSTPFSRRVKANFKVWDKNQDKKISIGELESAMHDHAISGADAAALATLSLTARQSKQKMVLSSAELVEYERLVSKGKRAPVDYDITYGKCRQKLEQAQTEMLWAMIGHLESAHQGRFDQCSIFVVAHDLSRHEVKELKQIVSKVGGSSYKISPPGRPSSILTVPSLAEIAAQSMDRRGCYLQKLIASACNQLKPVAPKSPQSLESLLSSAAMLSMIPLLANERTASRLAPGSNFKSRFSREQGLELVAWLR
jgi:hypothetical protein